MSERFVKILNHNRMPMHGGSGQWPEPGEWRAVEGDLIPCENGLHVCTIPQALTWLGPHIWAVEIDGERIDHADKIVVQRARIISEYETWNERTARMFACDCAERVLPAFERAYPNDLRPRAAIVTARRFANGEATYDELYAARAAAGDAARDTAGDAARDATRAAMRAATETTTTTTAGDVALYAARAAAWDAARDAESLWQSERLRQYLDGEVS